MFGGLVIILKKTSKVFFVLSLFFVSCNSPEAKISNAEKELDFTEQNKSEMTADDWSNLEIQMEELERELELNRENYTDEEIKDIGRLQGRYAALLAKKGMNDFQNSIDDLGNQLEGFMEGIKADTN